MLDFLNGHKTHILVFAGAVVTFLFSMDFISLKLYTALAGFLTFGTTSTLRHGIATVEEKVKEVAVVLPIPGERRIIS